MKNKSLPFTYLIGWSVHKKFYYGVRYGKSATPASLWTSYFTSSIFVHEFRAVHGEPDIIEVRKTFTAATDARMWEFKVLRRLHVSTSSMWLNRREAPAMPSFVGPLNGMFGKSHSKETRSKISAKAVGRIWTEDQIKRCQIRNAGTKNPFYKKSHTAESRAKIKANTPAAFGKDNPSAKTYSFRSPTLEVFLVVGGFGHFCTSNNLSISKMHRNIDKGVIPSFSITKTSTQQTINCVGWSVSLC
jgi:hypothetical protein